MRRSNSANSAHLPIIESYSDLQHQLHNKSRHDRHQGFAALSDDSDDGSDHDSDDSCREQYRIDPKGHHAASYLWKKRKEGLAQHPLSHPALLSAAAAAAAMSMEANFARSYSLRAIVTWLLLLCACYALSSLTTTPSEVIQQQQHRYRYPKATVNTYYLNIREPKGNPLEPYIILQSMFRAHAYAFGKGGHFGGVCGYPTLNPQAQQAQRDAVHILQQWGLAMELPFDVCPPLEAVLNRDEHFVLMEASELPPQTVGRDAHEEWKTWMESKRNQQQQQQHTAKNGNAADTTGKQANTANDIEALWQTLLRSGNEPERDPSGLPQQQQRRRLRGITKR